ncbi:hypothetical protein PV328_003309 [Microctonus aethiopoides]|uniref:Hexosyltransferase n=1 Tax=Microctonus aethiopoides TaxID=144406 RepID=A0AA39F8D5_9HYME|nr:hypothetical protein PV328_003309 [Microctonus aethiopoides]
MLMDLFGAFTHIFEKSYSEYFKYPYEGDILSSIEALKNKKKPDIEPINQYNYSYIHDIKDYCVDNNYHTLRLIFLVKSACENFHRRKAIRNSWGYKKRFFDVPTRTVFLLGKHNNDDELKMKIDEESKTYKDIMQVDFIDSYYNNTIKTMIGFRWAVTYCLNAKYYMFVDDDIYVSVKNVLRFIRNPASYPDYLKEPSRIGSLKREIRKSDMPNFTELPINNTNNIIINNQEYDNLNTSHRINNISNNNQLIRFKDKSVWRFYNNTKMSINANANIELGEIKNEKEESNSNEVIDEINSRVDNTLIRNSRQIFDFELPDDVRLFAGYVFISSPHRHKTSKWYVTLNEYAYDMWPPYVTAGAYILSKEALVDMYYTSFYTKHFRFDDIFLGLVAKKADIEPFHCDEFHFYKKDYTKVNYKYVITSHGYGDPDELLNVWNEQKSLGNA